MKTPVLLIASAVVLCPTGAWSQPVRVESGLLEGVQNGAVTAYEAIPFATAPTGELRWREPLPAVP